MRRMAFNVALLAAMAGGINLSAFADGYIPFVTALVGIGAIVGVGLNVLIGLAGQMSFGHVGFYSIGAYTVSLLLLKGVSFWPMRSATCRARRAGADSLVYSPATNWVAR